MEQYLFDFSSVSDKSDDFNAVTETKRQTERVTKKSNHETIFKPDGVHIVITNVCAALLVVFGIYKTIAGLLQLPSEHFPLGIINIVGTLLIWYGVYGLFSRESWSYKFVLCIALAGAGLVIAEFLFGWLMFGPHMLFISLLIIALIVLLSLSRKTLTKNTEV
jgi:hypothetical protein